VTRSFPSFRAAFVRGLTLLAPAFLAPALVLAQVSGIVVDKAGGAPIEGARVSVQASGVFTTTGPNGAFVLVAAAGGEVVVVGARKGYFNASARAAPPASDVRIVLEIVPQDDDPSYEHVDPVTCASCHPDQAEQWSGSPMADAGENSWVYDLYDGTGTAGGGGGFVYTRDSVHAAANPASECASCHQPESWLRSPFRALEDIRWLSSDALHGVSCEVCHKLADIDESRKNFPGLYPGVVTMTRPRGPSFHQVQYGVLGDSDFQLPAVMRPSYQPQLVAAACGACHQDKNDPDGDGDFEEEDGVVSEPTYLEWLASPYGDPASHAYATCADCHMPAYGATEVSIALPEPLHRDPSRIRHHRIEGTTAEYLENAVELRVRAEASGGVLEVEVSVANEHTGHHVPTGVTIRNMILLVEAVREVDGRPLVSLGTQTVHELGGVGDPGRGYFAGLPGKLYAKVSRGAGGEAPVFFTEATGVELDNRIPAMATDTTRYRFALLPGEAEHHVRGRLIYRRTFRALADAKGWTADGHGRPLEDLEAPHFGHLMESAEVRVVAGEPEFVRGDCNGDGEVTGSVSDALVLLRWSFLGGAEPPCLAACDANGDGRVVGEVSDAVYILSFNFLGGRAPPAPFPTCGPLVLLGDAALGCLRSPLECP
jgi:hypothetical protein